MISSLIPEPFRSQLVAAGNLAGSKDKPADELAVIAAAIDKIRERAAKAAPDLFKQAEQS